jgi:hypothetical protein
MKRIAVLSGAFLVALAAAVAAQEAKSTEATSEKKMAAPSEKKMAHPMAKEKHVAMNAADLKWGDAPPTLPAGAKLAVLEGDPRKPGSFAIRLQAPDGFKVMPHWHPTTEHLTVISGEFHVATGDKFDDTQGAALTAGGYGVMPAHMHHYAWAKGETVVQISGNGPFKIIYVNPSDDPSGMQGKKKATAKKAATTP